MWTGAKPVFADVRPDIWTRRPGRGRGRDHRRAPSASSPSTSFGQPADYDELRAIADKHGLWLVEDAACSAGATYKGRPGRQPRRRRVLQLPRPQGHHRRRGRRAHHRQRRAGRPRAQAAHLRHRARARPRGLDRPAGAGRSTSSATTTGCPTSRPRSCSRSWTGCRDLLAARRAGRRVATPSCSATSRRSRCRSRCADRDAPWQSYVLTLDAGDRPRRGRDRPARRRASSATSAPTPRTCSRVYGERRRLPGVRRPVRAAPRHPDARQPDRRSRSRRVADAVRDRRVTATLAEHRQGAKQTT